MDRGLCKEVQPHESTAAQLTELEDPCSLIPVAL